MPKYNIAISYIFTSYTNFLVSAWWLQINFWFPWNLLCAVDHRQNREILQKLGRRLTRWWRPLLLCNSITYITGRTETKTRIFCVNDVLSEHRERLTNYEGYILKGRWQWQRGLKHEPSSGSLTLGSWIRILLKAWIFVCAFILCLCCPVYRYLPCDGLITRPVSPIAQKRAVEPLMNEWMNEWMNILKEEYLSG
jgi:hypothetical protein